MKEAKIPEGAIPNAFDWRDKGALSCLKIILLNFATSFFLYLQRTVASLCNFFLVKLFFLIYKQRKMELVEEIIYSFLMHIVVLKYMYNT